MPTLPALAAPALLLAFLVVVAALVNRFAPSRRGSLRTPALLFLGYLLLSVGHLGANLVGGEGLARWLLVGERLAAGFCAAHLFALVVVDLGSRLLRREVPTLVGDLLAGLGDGVVFVAVATSAGVDPTSAVAGGTVVAAVLTISLQGTLGNVIGGVALQLDGSVELGDWIQLENGRQGRVALIRWRHVVLETRDGDSIVLPNSVLLTTPFTRLACRDGEHGLHRQFVYFRVDYRFSPARVCEVVQDALVASPIPNMATSPAPSVVCADLGKDVMDSSALYAVRYWIEDLLHDGVTDSDVRARIHAGLRRHGIPLALPAHKAYTAEVEDAAGRRQQQVERAFAALRSVDLFQALSDAECRLLAENVGFVPFAPGELVTRQGAIAHYLYLITSGEVEILVEVEGVATRVDTLRAPDFFGEMGLLTGEPRRASVVALSATDCFRVDRAAFEQVLARRPEMANQVAAALARRQSGLDAAASAPESGQDVGQEAEIARLAGQIRRFFGL